MFALKLRKWSREKSANLGSLLKYKPKDILVQCDTFAERSSCWKQEMNIRLGRLGSLDSFSVYSLFLYFLFLVESDSMGSLTLRERCNPRIRSLSIQGTLWFISLQMWSMFLVTFSSLFMLMTVRLPPNLRKFCYVSKTISNVPISNVLLCPIYL